MIIYKDNKNRTMEFAKVRPGTVITFEGKTYLRCEGDAAVDLITGEIIRPVNWDTCLIYNKASLKLGT